MINLRPVSHCQSPSARTTLKGRATNAVPALSNKTMDDWPPGFSVRRVIAQLHRHCSLHCSLHCDLHVRQRKISLLPRYVKVSWSNPSKPPQPKHRSWVERRRGRMLAYRDEVIDSDWWVGGALACLDLLHNLPHIPSTMTRNS